MIRDNPSKVTNTHISGVIKQHAPKRTILSRFKAFYFILV